MISTNQGGAPLFAVMGMAVSGTIVAVAPDTSGASVANANIAYKSVETGVARNVVADNLGAYTNTAFPVGAYDLEASAPGFKTEVRKRITVTVGASVTLNFTLQVGAVQETAEVNGETPQVNTADASLGGLVSDTTIRKLVEAKLLPMTQAAPWAPWRQTEVWNSPDPWSARSGNENKKFAERRRTPRGRPLFRRVWR